MKVQPLILKAYEPGDETAICGMFATVFGRPLAEEAWRWRYASNPSYRPAIELAWSGGTLVGHYAVLPVVLQVAGRDLLTGMSVATMTHPDARGRGLFGLLAANLYRRLADDGVSLIWGFPNRNIHGARVRDLSWVDVYEIPTFVKELKDGIRLPPHPAAIMPLHRFDARVDNLWEQVRGRYHTAVRRDSRYLSWRYGEGARAEYHALGYVADDQLLGYAVYKRYQDSVDLVDLLAIDDERAVELVSAVTQWAEREGLRAVGMWLNVHTSLHRSLERYGFVNREPITYLGATIVRPDLITPEVYHYQHWHLMMGDSDVY